MKPDADRKSRQRNHARGNYYDPPTEIKVVPGVELKQCPRTDFYTGRAAALVAAGLVSMDMLPGQPGRNVYSIAYRPNGEKHPEGRWYLLPGYMTIHRNVSETFRVALVVSHAEQVRRSKLYDEEAVAHRAHLRRQGCASTDEHHAEEEDTDSQNQRQALEAPKSDTEFRRYQLDLAEFLMGCIHAALGKDVTPFRFKLDDEDEEAIGEAFDLIREVIGGARVVRDAKIAAEFALVRRAIDAKADKPLQAFLRRVAP